MTGHFLHQDLLGSNVTIRSAGADDRKLLRRLAALDSADAPVGDVLLAEVDGEPRVALGAPHRPRRRRSVPSQRGRCGCFSPSALEPSRVEWGRVRADFQGHWAGYEPQGPPRNSRRDRAGADAAGAEDARAGAAAAMNPENHKRLAPAVKTATVKAGKATAKPENRERLKKAAQNLREAQPLSRRP